MAPRPLWKGHLKLSRVGCAVALLPATTDGEKLRFHTLNARTGHCVEARLLDAVTHEPVREEDEVRGYARPDGDPVVLEDAEIEAVALDSTRTIDIDRCVPADSIGWIWHDRPHFLRPADAAGQEAFALIRAALEATGTVGVSRLVLHRRERAVMLKPCGRGIVLWTLRFGDEVRDADAVAAGLPAERPEARLTRLMRRLIDARTVPWTPAMAADPVQDRLMEIIAAKQGGTARRARPRAPRPPVQDTVTDRVAALKRSLADEGRRVRR